MLLFEKPLYYGTIRVRDSKKLRAIIGCIRGIGPFWYYHGEHNFLNPSIKNEDLNSLKKEIKAEYE